METYFKIRTFFEFILPASVLGLIVLYTTYLVVINVFKSNLMEKFGYKYDRGLGMDVAYEFQPHWEKGHIRINAREIDRLKLSEIKTFIKSKEK